MYENATDVIFAASLELIEGVWKVRGLALDSPSSEMLDALIDA